MNESSDHDDARMEHPDLEAAVDEDEHGPVFEATHEGLDPTDDAVIVEVHDGRP